MRYNYARLRGRIVEICGNNGKFAKAMNLSEHTMSKKLNNEIPFKQPEITKAVAILDIDDNDNSSSDITFFSVYILVT